MSEPQNTPVPQRRRNPAGCLIYGLITVILVIAGIILGVYFGTRKAIQYAVETYTTNAPARIPTLELPEAERKQLAGSLVEQLRQALANRNGGEVVLGENELNLLIAESPDLALFQKQIYLRPEGNQLRAYMSLPLDQFEPWKDFAKRLAGEKWSGRYLNGMATVGATVTNSELKIFPKKVVVHATTLPDEFVQRFPWNNLTRRANSDPEVMRVLSRIESIEVREGKVHIRLRPQ